jgi:hypothetical protein
MQKLEELQGKRKEYEEKFKNLAKQFAEETGLYIEDVSFGYPLFIGTERLFDAVRVRLDVTLG